MSDVIDLFSRRKWVWVAWCLRCGLAAPTDHNCRTRRETRVASDLTDGGH